ncbi:hypothetical protein [Marinilactibacillus piezotolerans]|uniref:hypothetical protein n=1 Tax=Marinilactibacillus piezotolerans TaxID=258723 RepID=UPI0015C4894D|nr:hypothetical protein [Marinilactibacillus piezotolerans]
MEFKELEFWKEIQTKEKDLEITKEKLKAKVESTKIIEQNSAIKNNIKFFKRRI